MKKLLVITSLLLISNTFGAKLVYDNNRVYNEKFGNGFHLMVSKELHKDYSNSKVLVTDQTVGHLENWEEEIKTSVKPRIYYVPNEGVSGAMNFSTNNNRDHILNTYIAFKDGAGNTAFNNASSKFILTPYSMGFKNISGIQSYSIAKTGLPRVHTHGNSLYFGNHINEFMYHVAVPERFLYKNHSDNSNLMFFGMNNQESVEDANFKDDRNAIQNSMVVAPLATTTQAFTNYGVEAQKLYRAETVYVGAYACGKNAKGMTPANNKATLNTKFEVLTLENGIKYNVTANEANATCTLQNVKGKINQIPLYGRSMSVFNYNAVNSGKYVNYGTSFATPRTAGLAYRLQEKFKGMTLHQIKQVIFTTAARDKDQLSNETGWGFVDPNKALNGPSALNAGLIEEAKFFTGMYDKTFSYVDNNIFFWADVQNNWEWNNDIYGSLRDLPDTEYSYYNIMTDISPTNTIESVGGVADNVNIKNFIASEKNFYAKTSDYIPGLRKAGKGTLTINGNMYFEGETQVLEGHLIAKGNITGEFSVFEGATATITKENLNINNNVRLYGGILNIKGNTIIKKMYIEKPEYLKLVIDNNKKVIINEVGTNDETVKQMLAKMPNVSVGKFVTTKGTTVDIKVNPYKYANVEVETVFYGNGGNDLKYFDGENADYNKAAKKYPKMKDMDESIKQNIFGYRNGSYTLFNDNDVSGWSVNHYNELGKIQISKRVKLIHNKTGYFQDYSLDVLKSIKTFNGNRKL